MNTEGHCRHSFGCTFKVVAVDEDEGGNADLHYQIVAGNERQKFFIDPKSGVIYPNTSFVGLTGEQFVLTVEVSDEGGERKEEPKWRNPDRATVRIDIENVNTHAPGKINTGLFWLVFGSG